MTTLKPGAEPQPRVGKLNKSPNVAFKEPWTAALYDQLRLFSVQLLCSGGSGALAKTAVAPLERIKILRQVQHMSTVDASLKATSAWDAWHKIIRHEGGYRALWRGNGANVARLAPDVAFKFVVHDQFKIMFAPVDGSALGVGEKLAAAAATGVLKTLLFYPLDVARTRITADRSPAGPGRTYPTVRRCMATTLRTEGVTGLYRGLLLSMAGVVPYLSISFTAYDELKARLPTDRASQSQLWYPFLKMGCGAAAAMSAQVLVYPVDTVRRCVMMSGAQGTAQGERYAGGIDCFIKLLRSQGPAALYRGCLANSCKTMLGAPIQFVMYDLIKSTMQALDPTTGVTSPL